MSELTKELFRVHTLFNKSILFIKNDSSYRILLLYTIMNTHSLNEYIPFELFLLIYKSIDYISSIELNELKLIHFYDVNNMVSPYCLYDHIVDDYDTLKLIEDIYFDKIISLNMVPYILRLICLLSSPYINIEYDYINYNISKIYELDQSIEDSEEANIQRETDKYKLICYLLDIVKIIDPDNEQLNLNTIYYRMYNIIEFPTVDDIIKFIIKNKHLYYKVINSKVFWKENSLTFKFKIFKNYSIDFHMNAILFMMIMAFLECDLSDELIYLINNYLTKNNNNTFDTFTEKFDRLLSLVNREKLIKIKENIHNKKRRLIK